MNPTSYVPLLQPTITGLALLLSIVTLFYTVRLNRKTNSTASLIDFAREWRKEGGIRDSYIWIKKNNLRENKENLAMSQLEPDKLRHAQNVSHYFDNLGVLLYCDIVRKYPLLSFVGGAAMSSWEMLGSYIENERILRAKEVTGDCHYQRHFQYVAALNRLRVSGINKDLDRLKKEMETIFGDRMHVDQHWKRGVKLRRKHRWWSE